MKKADIRQYKERLLLLRARLQGDVSAMATSALKKTGTDGTNDGSMPIHMAELGSESFEQEFTLSLLQTEEETLQLIEAALERAESGDYGTCQGCGGSIPKMRLNAIPYASHCIRCAESQENG